MVMHQLHFLLVTKGGACIFIEAYLIYIHNDFERKQ